MKTLNEVRDFIYNGLSGKFTNLNTLSKFTVIEEDEGFVHVNIYTCNNKYSIVGTTGGYLGCIVTKRKPLADDHHTHGSDLADGELNDETMFAILQDIVSYELVDK